jgi:GAF domain-containing protein/HAMP domain-containing protein
MNLFATNPTLQFIIWIIGVIELILALYVISLNYKHTTNRHIAALFALFAINSFAIGWLIAASDTAHGNPPAALLAATLPIFSIALLLTAIVLIKPRWMTGRRRGLWLILYGITFIPIITTTIDWFFETNLWFARLDPETYSGGLVELSAYTNPVMTPMRLVNLIVIPLLTLFPLLYFSFRDRDLPVNLRRLARILLGTLVLVILTQISLSTLIGPTLPTIIANSLYFAAYAYATFSEVVLGRKMQSGRLQPRLTALILSITIPLLIANVVFVSYRAREVVNKYSMATLDAYRAFQGVLWAATIGVIIGIAILIIFTSLTIRQAIGPIGTLTETASAIADGDFSRIAPVESQDEIGFLAENFNRMTERLLEAIGGLELRVTSRTRDLQERSVQLQAATEVGRIAFSILDLDQLIQEVVNVIREHFELYYVGLFLVDQQHEWAVLQAGTGEAGKAMLARQHSIRIGQGMIGWSITNSQARIAQEAGEDAVRLASVELPDTRSEAAIPLRSRGKVIGALSVQSTIPGAFDESSIAILQTMADMVSVAIDNARLYADSEQALEATRRAYGEVGRDAWMNIIDTAQQELGFRSDRNGVSPSTTVWTPEIEKAWNEGRTVILDEGSVENQDRVLAVPIKVRDNVIGVLHTGKPPGSRNWTEDEINMIENIVEQMGVVLDSARLYSDTQKQAQRERLTAEMTNKLYRALDMDSLMQTLIQEISTALDIDDAFIQLSTPPESIAESGNGKNT